MAPHGQAAPRASRTGSEERVIGEHTYRVQRLGARAGCTMAVKLAKWLAPSAASGVEGIVGARSDAFGSIALGVSDSLRVLVERVSAEELASVQLELAKHTTVLMGELEPQLSAIYDEHFAGHYDWLMAWLAFALEVNFRSFFGGTGAALEFVALVERIAGLMERLAPASPSQPGSTGTSTESPRPDATATA